MCGKWYKSTHIHTHIHTYIPVYTMLQPRLSFVLAFTCKRTWTLVNNAFMCSPCTGHMCEGTPCTLGYMHTYVLHCTTRGLHTQTHMQYIYLLTYTQVWMHACTYKTCYTHSHMHTSPEPPTFTHYIPHSMPPPTHTVLTQTHLKSHMV